MSWWVGLPRRTIPASRRLPELLFRSHKQNSDRGVRAGGACNCGWVARTGALAERNGGRGTAGQAARAEAQTAEGSWMRRPSEIQVGETKTVGGGGDKRARGGSG